MEDQPLLHERHSDNEVVEATEQTPLIAAESSASGPQANREGRLHSLAKRVAAALQPRRPGAVMAVLCVIIFVASLTSGFQDMPLTRIFEDILCRRYYDQIRSKDEPIDEDMCKVDAVQSKLAYLFAIQAALTAAVSILAALPWGIAADKIGRRPVFAISMTGVALGLLWVMAVGWFNQTFAPQLVLLSPIAFLLGGGNPVLAATLTSLAIDIVPASERSACFMRIHGASMVGNLLSPALASVMMSSTGPWPPVFVSLLVIVLPAFAIFLVPETLEPKSQNAESDNTSLKAHVVNGIRELTSSAHVFATPSMIIILIITMLQLTLSLGTFQFLGQFTSKRYHIPLAETGYIQSVYGIAFSTVSFFVLPFFSSAILKSSAPAFIRFDDDKRRDLFLARGSYIVSLIATLILGSSGSLSGFVFGLVILAHGVSAEGFLKSTATFYVTAEQRSRLYTMLGLAAIASNLWASPALAALFSLGMKLGGTWVGLPYFGISGLCVLMFAMSLFIKIPRPSDADQESAPEGVGSG
ncbi:major facilitator superfamily domain-containing protein [Nemania sp. FL0916]|nr:major facilitator superfamily domain-containing protein [Nemania sp. FL0916]